MTSVKTATKPKSVHPRIAWIDLLETIAIVSVVFYHCTAHIGNLPYTGGSLSFFLHYAFRSLAAVCVPLFFFANGYLLLSRPFDLKRHLWKTLRFVLIALFWYGATLAFLLLLHHDQLSTDGFSATLSSLKYGVTHLWYLGALVCLYVFFPLLKVAYDHHRAAFIYFIVICALITFGNTLLNHLLTFISTFLTHQGIIYHETNFFNIFNPFRGIYGYTFVYFGLGGLVAASPKRIKSIPVRTRNLAALAGLLLSWLGLFGLGLMYSQASGQIWDNVWFGYDSIFTLVATLSIFLLCLNWKTDTPIFRTISRNTLGIYLTHMLIIFTLTTWFSDFILRYASPVAPIVFPISFLGVILYTLVVLSLSLLLTLLLRSLPFLRRLVS